MRTTLEIDDHLLSVARARAREQGISLGKVVSELIERGLTRPALGLSETGFPVYHMPDDAGPITMDLVNEFRDGDDSTP